MKLVDRIDQALDACCNVLRVFGTVMLCLMLVFNLINLGLRIAHRQELASLTQWTEVLFVWMCFAGFYVIHRTRRDIVVDFLVDRLGARLQAVIPVFVDLVVLSVMVAILSQTARIVELQQATIDLVGIPKYCEAMGLFVAAALVALDVLLHLFHLTRGRPHTPLPVETDL